MKQAPAVLGYSMRACECGVKRLLIAGGGGGTSRCCPPPQCWLPLLRPGGPGLQVSSRRLRTALRVTPQLLSPGQVEAAQQHIARPGSRVALGSDVCREDECVLSGDP